MGLSRPLRWAVAVLAVVLTVVSASWFVRQAHEWPVAGLDGRVYRDAARAFLDREDVYSGRFQGLPFTYPPFALLVFVPLALVPENAATLLMFAASSAALVAVVRWCQDYATRGRAGSWWLTVALAAPVAVAVEPVRTTLSLGQVNVVLLALVLGLDARATRWSGVGAGLATAIKIAPGLLVVAQAVRSDWRAFRRGVLAFVVATGLAAVLAPAATRTYFTDLLWDSSRPGGLDYLQNQSLRGVLARHAPHSSSLIWLVGAVLVLALGAWVVRRHRRDPFYALTAAGLTGLLVSPVSWSHHWVWVLPIVAVGVRSGRRSPVSWTALALLASTIVELLYWTSGDAPLVTQDMYVVLGLAWLVAAAVTVPSREDPASVPAQKADAVGSTS
jgi:alpha-1,2-mannosyltransferase